MTKALDRVGDWLAWCYRAGPAHPWRCWLLFLAAYALTPRPWDLVVVGLAVGWCLGATGGHQAGCEDGVQACVTAGEAFQAELDERTRQHAEAVERAAADPMRRRAPWN